MQRLKTDTSTNLPKTSQIGLKSIIIPQNCEQLSTHICFPILPNSKFWVWAFGVITYDL